MSNSLLTILLLLTIGCAALASGPMTGGWTQLDVNDQKVKNLTDLAVDRYNQQSNSINMKQLVTIKSAKHQLVAGSKYAITFAVGETNCSKNGIQTNSYKDCPLTNSSVSRAVQQRLGLPVSQDCQGCT